VDRLIAAPLRDFEIIWRAALERDRFLAHALYPPGCARSHGRVVFQTGRTTSGVTLSVDPAVYSGAVKEVLQLFAGGALNFSTPQALHDFCHGPLAAAFAASASAVAADARLLDAAKLAARLAHTAGSPPSSLARLSEIVARELARTKPTRPVSIAVLADSHQLGAAVVAALPDALAEQGRGGFEVTEFDCRALASETSATSIVGVSPGLVGYDPNPPLVRALRRQWPLLVFCDLEHAHQAVVERVLVPLFGRGRVVAPNGDTVDAVAAIVAVTTTVDYEQLLDQLDENVLCDRRRLESACRSHLIDHGLPAALVDELSGVVMLDQVADDSLLTLAEQEIRSLAGEYGLALVDVDASIAGAVVDVAERLGGARALRHAARDLLATTFADARPTGASHPLLLAAGPPPALLPQVGR
jgi:hypothetical protein